MMMMMMMTTMTSLSLSAEVGVKFRVGRVCFCVNLFYGHLYSALPTRSSNRSCRVLFFKGSSQPKHLSLDIKMWNVRSYASVTTLCLCRCCHTRNERTWNAMTWTGFVSCEYDSLSNISRSLSALVEFQISALVSQFRSVAVRKFNFVSPSVL
jgi:hypothetical protein